MMVMKRVFNVNLNKRDAVEAALWCLRREHDIESIESDDIYINELKQEKKSDTDWSDLADSQ